MLIKRQLLALQQPSKPPLIAMFTQKFAMNYFYRSFSQDKDPLNFGALGSG